MCLDPSLSLYFWLILRLMCGKAARRSNLDLSSPNPPDRRPHHVTTKHQNFMIKGNKICRDIFADKFKQNRAELGLHLTI